VSAQVDSGCSRGLELALRTVDPVTALETLHDHHDGVEETLFLLSPLDYRSGSTLSVPDESPLQIRGPPCLDPDTQVLVASADGHVETTPVGARVNDVREVYIDVEVTLVQNEQSMRRKCQGGGQGVPAVLDWEPDANGSNVLLTGPHHDRSEDSPLPSVAPELLTRGPSHRGDRVRDVHTYPERKNEKSSYEAGGDGEGGLPSHRPVGRSPQARDVTLD
jgi:hypothetical protein